MGAIFDSISPVLCSLILGYLSGKALPNILPTITSRLIEPLVWLLLLLLGIAFARVLKGTEVVAYIIYTAALFALLTTMSTCLLICAFCKLRKVNKMDTIRNKKIDLTAPIKECVIALLMVLIGVILSIFLIKDYRVIEGLEEGNVLIYILIFFVGIEVASIKLSSGWCCFSVVFLPLLVVIGSIGGGLLSSLIAGEYLMTSLALSSGFGWFPLSSALVSSRIGVTYGAIALLTDLFRELLAIILMYLFGHVFSKECIGAGGATTRGSTLPIIRQSCTKEVIPIALVSGLVLTLLTPVLITFFLSNGH